MALIGPIRKVVRQKGLLFRRERWAEDKDMGLTRGRMAMGPRECKQERA